MSAQEGSTPSISIDLLRGHFVCSYLLMLAFPLLDVIVYLPIHFAWPRTEFLISILLGLTTAILTIFSFSDIYAPQAYRAKEYRVISVSARLLLGISWPELTMIAAQIGFLYHCWPFLFKNIRCLWHRLRWGSLEVIAMRKLAANSGSDSEIIPDHTYDMDAFALLLANLLRLFCVQLKTLFARSIRIQTCLRNLKMSHKYNLGALPNACAILCYRKRFRTE